VEPRVVDSRRCISYQTIENRGDIPGELQPLHGDWLFGCDICQEVCPWNRFARESTEEAFRPRAGQANPEAREIVDLNEKEFDARFAGTAIRRAKHAGMQRNARVVLENQLRETDSDE
jgi:epoxyqueuosine reductase